MKSKLSIISFFIISILLDACIEPFSLTSMVVNPKFTVDGLITDEPGPYQVKLFYSTAPDGKEKVKFETGAKVQIISSANESEWLTEISPGVYNTNPKGIRGRVGLSYRLKIVTSAGDQYETKEQELLPVGTLDNLYYEFEVNGTSFPEGAKIDTRDVLNIFIDAAGVRDKSNLFRWRWTGVYKATTFPEKNMKTVGNRELPAPLPCSGYVYGGGALRKVGECTCCICWAHEYGRSSIVSDNVNSEEYQFTKVLLSKIPFTRMRFYDKYYVEVEQLSITEDVYKFWKLTQDQQRASGNLFQPNSVKIRGNVYCVNKPAEEVLGVFSVSAIARKSLFIDPAKLPYRILVDTLALECENAVPNPTKTQPTFW